MVRQKVCGQRKEPSAVVHLEFALAFPFELARILVEEDDVQPASALSDFDVSAVETSDQSGSALVEISFGVKAIVEIDSRQACARARDVFVEDDSDARKLSVELIEVLASVVEVDKMIGIGDRRAFELAFDDGHGQLVDFVFALRYRSPQDETRLLQPRRYVRDVLVGGLLLALRNRSDRCRLLRHINRRKRLLVRPRLDLIISFGQPKCVGRNRLFFLCQSINFAGDVERFSESTFQTFNCVAGLMIYEITVIEGVERAVGCERLQDVG